MRVAFRESGPRRGSVMPIIHQTVWDSAVPVIFSPSVSGEGIPEKYRDYKGPWVPVFRGYARDLMPRLRERGFEEVPFDAMLRKITFAPRSTTNYLDDLIFHGGNLACSGRFYVSSYQYGMAYYTESRDMIVLLVPAEALLDDDVALSESDAIFAFHRAESIVLDEYILRLEGLTKGDFDLEFVLNECRLFMDEIMPIGKYAVEDRENKYHLLLNFDKLMELLRKGDVKGFISQLMILCQGIAIQYLINMRLIDFLLDVEKDSSGDDKYGLYLKRLRESPFFKKFLDLYEKFVREESDNNKKKLREILNGINSTDESEKKEAELMLMRFMDSLEEIILGHRTANEFRDNTRLFSLDDKAGVFDSIYRTNLTKDHLYLPGFSGLRRLLEGNSYVLSGVVKMATGPYYKNHYIELRGDPKSIPSLTTFSIGGFLDISFINTPEEEDKRWGGSYNKFSSQDFTFVEFNIDDPGNLLERYNFLMAQLKDMPHKNEAVLMLIELLSHFRPYIEAFAPPSSL